MNEGYWCRKHEVFTFAKTCIICDKTTYPKLSEQELTKIIESEEDYT